MDLAIHGKRARNIKQEKNRELLGHLQDIVSREILQDFTSSSSSLISKVLQCIFFSATSIEDLLFI